MTTTEYFKDFWTVRLELEKMDVKQPLGDMVRCGLIEPSTYNNNHLSGRVRDDKFLKCLIDFEAIATVSWQIVNSVKNLDSVTTLINLESSQFDKELRQPLRVYTLHLFNLVNNHGGKF